jgi:hypothetical protein
VVAFSNDNGVAFYAVHKSFPGKEFNKKYSRKIHADIFVDDRNIGGFIDWTEVYKQILNYEPELKKRKEFSLSSNKYFSPLFP